MGHSVNLARIALVCMPFASASRPSIQIGLITSVAQRAGFVVDPLYFNLTLAAQMTPQLYENFCQHRGEMTGEWLFSKAAFGKDLENSTSDYFNGYPSEVRWIEELDREKKYLVSLRDHTIPNFVNNVFKSVDWAKYPVVAFSTTFQQNVACLALSKKIKAAFPDCIIVFGGANMEGEMGRELVRAFPFIDIGVSGEADSLFPLLLERIRNGQSFDDLQGVLTRISESEVIGQQCEPITDLDGLPTPNYEAYFEQIGKLGLQDQFGDTWGLPFESSRGCWWGQKHHCTFCGLNGLGMSYRAKSPKRVMQELDELTNAFGINNFEAVDNILDMKYLSGLFTELAELKLDYKFFYELKVNMTREQIKIMKNGGVQSVQPGIESMSSNILSLMRKGSNMLQNVRFLKWSKYYNIKVNWNILLGFPGETIEDYDRQLEVLKAIQHLEPPVSANRIWLERYSPYYTDRESFGVRLVEPKSSYRHVYPNWVNLDKLAYFFDYEMDDTLSDIDYECTRKMVEEWNLTWNSSTKPALVYRRTSTDILLDRKRADGNSTTQKISGPLAEIYEYCGDTMRSVENTTNFINENGRNNFSNSEVRDVLKEFCKARLMIGENGNYLSLALPVNPNW